MNYRSIPTQSQSIFVFYFLFYYYGQSIRRQYYKSETSPTDSSHRERITFPYFSFNVEGLVSFDMIILSIEIIIGMCVLCVFLRVNYYLLGAGWMCLLVAFVAARCGASIQFGSFPSIPTPPYHDRISVLIWFPAEVCFFDCGWWRRDVAMNLTLFMDSFLLFLSLSLLLVSSLALSKCQRSSSFCGWRVYLVTFTWGNMWIR